MEECRIYTDGAARGNPGPAAIGMVFLDSQGNLISEHKESIGTATNNQAEYKAVIRALELAVKYCKNRIILTSDSELIIRQLTGKYRVKNKNLIDLFRKAKTLEASYEKVSYRHQPRTDKYLKIADGLCNEVLDERR